jgi:hypothetical protein
VVVEAEHILPAAVVPEVIFQILYLFPLQQHIQLLLALVVLEAQWALAPVDILEILVPILYFHQLLQ